MVLGTDEIYDLFMQSINCAQVVVGQAADEIGADKAQAVSAASPFGAGMFSGDTCGAVAGALMAIGLKYGNGEPGGHEQSAHCREKAVQFQQLFRERHGSTICRDILGYDYAVPGEFEQASLTGKIREACPACVQTALELLEELFDEE